jgi:RNase P subunit RPR2
MSDQTKDCEACFGTGNEARMRAVQPGRKILFQPCPTCGGSGKVPIKKPGARDLKPRAPHSLAGIKVQVIPMDVG